MITLDVPNLDAETLDPEDMAEFSKNCDRLAGYAMYKTEAMRSRLAGKVREAQGFERRCEMLYQLLPPSWQW